MFSRATGKPHSLRKLRKALNFWLCMYATKKGLLEHQILSFRIHTATNCNIFLSDSKGHWNSKILSIMIQLFWRFINSTISLGKKSGGYSRVDKQSRIFYDRHTYTMNSVIEGGNLRICTIDHKQKHQFGFLYFGSWLKSYTEVSLKVVKNILKCSSKGVWKNRYA